MVFDACDSFLFAGATSKTVTATTYSDALEIKQGGTGLTNPVHVVVRFSSARNTSGSNGLQFNVQTSTNGTAWFDHASGDRDKVALTSSAQGGVVNLPVVTQDPFVRVAAVISGGGAGSTMTILSADLNIAQL